jgi:hypothetical protein
VPASARTEGRPPVRMMPTRIPESRTCRLYLDSAGGLSLQICTGVSPSGPGCRLR